ncbi:MAG: hypothetical protein K6L80_15570 [Agarilytica sp.]
MNIHRSELKKGMIGYSLTPIVIAIVAGVIYAPLDMFFNTMPHDIVNMDALGTVMLYGFCISLFFNSIFIVPAHWLLSLIQKKHLVFYMALGLLIPSTSYFLIPKSKDGYIAIFVLSISCLLSSIVFWYISVFRVYKNA